MRRNEEDIERSIVEAGKTAPRLNPKHIDDTIVSEQFHVFEPSMLTVCALTLRNGFVVVGTSAAASPENYDRAIGERVAREKARNEIWQLEGYLLRQKLAEVAAGR